MVKSDENRVPKSEDASRESKSEYQTRIKKVLLDNTNSHNTGL